MLSPHYNAPGLDRPKIKYVLSVIDGQDKQPKVPPGHESEFVLKFVSLRDSPTDDILKILGNAIAFIQTSLTNNDGGVLVHCQKGVSRSGSVMIGFIMEEMNLNYDVSILQIENKETGDPYCFESSVCPDFWILTLYQTALRYVRSSRSKIRPNSGFEQQLILWGTLRYNIHDDQGNEKPEYIAWKKENEAKIKAPRIANQI